MALDLPDTDVYQPPPVGSAPRAVYIHVPFCLHRCGYCDFTLVAQRDDLIPSYLTALKNELSRIDTVYEVDTIFIGGGTPTHLSVDQFRQLANAIHSKFRLSDGGEFSVEGNPDGLNDELLRALSDFGVNRLSLGVQSFNNAVLQALERQHTEQQAQDAIDRAAAVIPNLSTDLIFGVPGQSLETWHDSLCVASQLPLTHVSTYGLTFEKGTDFFRRQTTGTLQALPDELEREMYALGMSHLSEAGFRHYEISNFAKAGFACRHNMVYWAAAEYFAFGPGAARYVNGVRSTNARSVVRWVNHWLRGESALQECESLGDDARIREAIFLGLRRIDGIDLSEFQQKFGVDIRQIEPTAVQSNTDGGLLETVDGRLCLTQEGRFLADSVMADFL